MTQVQKTLEKFFSKFKKIELPKKSIILDEGQAPPGVYYLAEGWVRIYSICPKGNELTLHIADPGSYFPMEQIIGEVKHSYIFESISPVVLYLCPKEEFIKKVEKNPEILLDLVRRLTSGVFKLLSRIEIGYSASAAQRIESVLIYLVRHFGNPINLHFTHLDIAKIAGLTRETVSLEMEKLKKAGEVIYKGRKLIYTNL